MKVVRLALIMGVPFGLGMGVFTLVGTGNVALSLLVVLPTGAAFGLPMSLYFTLLRAFGLRHFKDDEKHFEKGESIRHEGPANRLTTRKPLFGKLYLTNQRLRFRARPVTIRAVDVSVLLSEIAQARGHRLLGLIPNILVVTLHSGQMERYKVEDRAGWLRALSEAGIPTTQR
jgi:hypothetical protein